MKHARVVAFFGLALAACARPPVRVPETASARAPGSAPAPAAERSVEAPAPRTDIAVSTGAATPTAVDLRDVRACEGKDGEECTRTTDARLDGAGLSMRVEEERVRAVTTPRSSSLTTGGTLGMLLGFGDNVFITGYNFGFNARYLDGGLFPGAEGGSWLGLFMEPSATLGFNQIVTETPSVCVGGRCSGGGEERSYSGSLTLSLSAGLQYMSFDPMDSASIQQAGWGLFGGAQVGSLIPLDEGEATSNFGPAFGFVRSKYNPGTGAFETSTLNVFVLPTSELFFLVVGGGFNEG